VGEISAKEAMRAAGAEAQKILDGEQ